MATKSTNRPQSSQSKASSKQSVQKNTKLSPQKKEVSPFEAEKTKYKQQLLMLRQLFSETWNDDDLLSVLQEVNGDLDIAITRISEGHAEQWSTQSSRKNRKEKKTEQSSTQSSLNQANIDQDQNFKRSFASTRGRGRGRGTRGGKSPAIGRQTRTEDYSQTNNRNDTNDQSTSESKPWSSSVEKKSESNGAWSNNVKSASGVSWASEPVEKQSGPTWADDASSTAATAGSVISSLDQKYVESTTNGWNSQAGSMAKSWSRDEIKSEVSTTVGNAWGSSTEQTKKQQWSNDLGSSPYRANVSDVISSPIKEEVTKKSPGWGAGEASTKISSAAGWGSVPAKSDTQTTVGASSQPKTGKSTWAQIAKPEPPKAAAAAAQVQPQIQKEAVKQVQKPRQPSPKRSVSPQRSEPLTQSDQKQQSPIGKPSAQFGLGQAHAQSNAADVGIKFGSLGINEDEKPAPISASPIAPPSRQPNIQASQQQAAPVNESQNYQAAQSVPTQQPLNSYAQYQTQPQAFNIPDYNTIYSQLTSNPAGAAQPQANGAQPIQSQQGMPGVGGYAMNPASLANMYAAYFPYYMSQFNAGGPFSTGPVAPQPSYNQSGYMAGTQQAQQGYPRYQSGSQQQFNPQQGQQKQSHTPSAAPGFGGYFGQQQQQQQQQGYNNNNGLGGYQMDRKNM